MESPTLAEKMAKQPFSRNQRMIPKKEKIHPVMKQAHAAFMRNHGSAFARNAGRGFGKKAK